MSTFDPTKFVADAAKPLPVILLLDVSGSMSGEKILNLNEAVKDMLDEFRKTESGEVDIQIAIITFGAEVKLHQALSGVHEVVFKDLSAYGGTPFGTALRMAKAMIEDKEVLPKRAYRPTVVVVSDGRPGDSWQQPLEAFIGEGRSSKCDRMAMAIGADADEGVLSKFIQGTSHPLFYAENARQLRDFFKFVTMSVTIRTKSKTRDVVPPASEIDVKPATIVERPEQPKSATQDFADATERDEKKNEEGYW
jgi:uncharacterized protein YegL